MKQNTFADIENCFELQAPWNIGPFIQRFHRYEKCTDSK